MKNLKLAPMGGGGGNIASMMLGNGGQGGDGEPDGDEQMPSEIPIPLAMLSQPDDQEQMQTPKQGDSVDFQVTATVTRIEGDCAYVKPEAVNGQPLDNEGDEAPGADAQEESDLRQQAQAMSGGQNAQPDNGNY